MKRILQNMFTFCDACELTFNQPFCPGCEVPKLGRDHYTPRLDGVDGELEALEREAARDARRTFKNGDSRDLVDIFSADDLD